MNSGDDTHMMDRSTDNLLVRTASHDHLRGVSGIINNQQEIETKISKLSTVLDKEHIFENVQQNITAEENKKKYIDNFCVEFKLNNFYICDSKIYKKDPDYSIQLINRTIITDDGRTMETITHDKKHIHGTVAEQNENLNPN